MKRHEHRKCPENRAINLQCHQFCEYFLYDPHLVEALEILLPLYVEVPLDKWRWPLAWEILAFHLLLLNFLKNLPPAQRITSSSSSELSLSKETYCAGDSSSSGKTSVDPTASLEEVNCRENLLKMQVCMAHFLPLQRFEIFALPA